MIDRGEFATTQWTMSHTRKGRVYQAVVVDLSTVETGKCGVVVLTATQREMQSVGNDPDKLKAFLAKLEFGAMQKLVGRRRRIIIPA